MLLTCHLKLKIKSKTECPLLRHKLFAKIKHLPILPTVNPPLEGFAHILTGFYHLLISLVLFTCSLIDAQVGLNYTLS